MKYLYYHTYCSGRSGLSNNIMSLELGVVLAHLLERVLVIDGNVAPPANLVHYAGRVSNRHRSRVVDLLEMPVPWIDAGHVDLEGLESRELSDQPLMQSLFYHPASLDLETDDFRAFAKRRRNWLCDRPEDRELPVLRLSGGPPSESRLRLFNFGFYSYFFYLDAPAHERVRELLRRMAPRPHLAALAQTVAKELGEFNAVHVRRGDFKKTTGVTTRDRTAAHALETMDQSFRRDDTLVILTDERDDPFFEGLLTAYPKAIFLDHWILDHFGDEFADLPTHDSIALAFLSQLVASHAKDFIGSMTSTFTSLIQRYRGSRGLHEPFKFLWNEIPDQGDELEPGRHRFSECVPLDAGVMVEQHEGPYSWNRYNPRIAPAWMREWPESFLPAADET